MDNDWKMKGELTYREALIVELVYELSRGNEKELGYSLEEIVMFLRTPIKNKEGLNALECLDSEGRQFIEELVKFLKRK